MARLPEPLKIEVRWPGGRTTTSDLPSDARDVEAGINGEIKVLRRTNN